MYGGDAEGVYRDVDASWTLTEGDVYLGGTAQTLGWISGAVCKFNYIGAQDERAWSKVDEPNDHVWDWTDIGNVKVRVETNTVGVGEDSTLNKIYVYEIWLTIYRGAYPPEGPGVSIKPPVVLGLTTDNYFFVDVFVTDVVRMHGFQFLIYYDTTVLTALELSQDIIYNPFFLAGPSEVRDDLGYVSVAYSSYMGDPVGFTGSGPVLRIYFKVDSEGTSTIYFDSPGTKSILTNVFGPIISVDYWNNCVFATYPSHNVAVTTVATNTTQAAPGEKVRVDVTVENKGTDYETFDVKAYYESTPIEPTQTVTGLEPGSTLTLNFDWDTTGVPVSLEGYLIKAEAVLATDEDPSDNVLEDGRVTIGNHDMAVTKVLRAYPTPDVAITEREPAIRDVDSSGTYTAGVDEVLAGTAPLQGVFLLKTPGPKDKFYDQNDNGVWDQVSPSPYKEAAIRDVNDDGIYDSGDVVLAGTTPALGVTLKISSNPLDKYADKNDNNIWDAGELLTVTKKEIVYINITVTNVGHFSESGFNVTALYIPPAHDQMGGKDIPTNQYGEAVLKKWPDQSLEPGVSKNYSYTWNTETVVFETKENSTLRTVGARVTEVSNEKSVANNVRFDGGVNVTKPPIEALFDITPDIRSEMDRVVGNPIVFNAERSYSFTKNTKLERFEWDFGDETKVIYVIGVNATLPHTTTHKYTQTGTYTVFLTVKNNITQSDTKNQTLTIYSLNIAITAATASPTKVIAGEIVNIDLTVMNQDTVKRTEDFSISVYYDSTKITIPQTQERPKGIDTNGTSQTYRVDWNTTGVNPGTYTIKVEIKPSNALTLQYEINKDDDKWTDGTVRILGYPVANFTYTPSKPVVNEAVTFNATVSHDTDPGGTIEKYEWDFGDGSKQTFVKDVNLTAVTTHAFQNRTLYTVNLTVTDNDQLSNSFAKNVTIYVHDVAVTSVTATPTEVVAGESVTISVEVANQGDFDETVSLTVKYGDQNGEHDIQTQTVTLSVLESTTVPFTWETGNADAGTYTIKAVASIAVDNDPTDNTREGDQQVVIKAGSSIFIYAVAGVAIAAVIAGVLVYLLKFRKPKLKPS